MTIVEATWVEGYKIRIKFRDLSLQIVDFGPYLAQNSHPYIAPYKDKEQFKTFRIDNGNLVWGDDWDMIFPNYKLHRGFI